MVHVVFAVYPIWVVSSSVPSHVELWWFLFVVVRLNLRIVKGIWMWFWSSLGFGSLFWSRFGFGFDCGTFLGEVCVVVDESVDAVVSFG